MTNWKLINCKLKRTIEIFITCKMKKWKAAKGKNKHAPHHKKHLIFIFRLEGEQPHQDLLLFYRMLGTWPKSNTTADRLKAA